MNWNEFIDSVVEYKYYIIHNTSTEKSVSLSELQKSVIIKKRDQKDHLAWSII